jgi:hypothetical protein
VGNSRKQGANPHCGLQGHDTLWSGTCVSTFWMKITADQSPRSHDSEGHNTHLHRREKNVTCGPFCKLQQGLGVLKYNGLLESDTV